MVCDSTVALLIAVILLRTFAAEGYLISTGSMAPALLGYHHRVTCPECQQTFAVGTAYDASVEQPIQQGLRATCPNCSLGGIELTDVPINHGDQLLVFKQAYALRPPGRWETAVFRNPSQPTEAFVKRVIALPGEQVQVVDGDVFIGGTRLQKDWPEQRALRILVHDDRHQPQDTRRFRRAWEPVTATGQHPLGHTQTASDTHTTGWQRQDGGFHFQPTATGQPNSLGQTGDSRVAWLAFQRWVRSRPAHPLSIMFAGGALPGSSSTTPEIERLSGVTLDRQRGELSVRGSMPEITRDQLLALSPEPGYHAAVEELYRASHQSGIDDRSSYNAIDLGDDFHPVRDVMLSALVQIRLPGSATGMGTGTETTPQELLLSIGEQPNQALIVFDFAHQELRISRDRQPLRKQPFVPAETWTTKGVLLEVSLFDQQLRLALNGADVLGPVPWPDSPAGSVRVLAGTSHVTDSAGIVPQGATLQLGARGLATTVQNLQVWRDVYYTSDRSLRGISQPYMLAANEYFVLGDNSAISHDSRRWTGSGVTSSLLIGKPFVVHLPSRPARLKVGPYEWPVRLPDWDRIRWVY